MSWITEFIAARREKAEDKRRAAAEKRAKEVVQIREFCGVLYLSYNDVPTVPMDMLNKDVAEVLDAAREAYTEYFSCWQ